MLTLDAQLKRFPKGVYQLHVPSSSNLREVLRNVNVIYILKIDSGRWGLTSLVALVNAPVVGFMPVGISQLTATFLKPFEVKGKYVGYTVSVWLSESPW